MRKVMVVYDGTEASRMLFELMQKRVSEEVEYATVVRYDIKRDSESGLSSGSGVSEFRGRIDDLAANIGDAELLLVHLAPVSHEIIDSAKKLKYIGTERSSVPNIDTAYARNRGIKISYSAGRNVRTVAEFTVGLMLDVTRNISASDALVKAGEWNRQLDRRPYTGIEMEGKTIGLYGFGGIGKQVAKLLSGFGVNILYYDPFMNSEWNGCKPVSRDQLFAESDILSIHARSDDESCLIHGDDIRKMKAHSYLINTARGYLIDEHALIEELQNGHLRGAALDVYMQEPIASDSPLLKMKNVVLCPHLGGLSQDMNPRSAQFVAEDAIHYLKGEALVHEYKA